MNNRRTEQPVESQSADLLELVAFRTGLREGREGVAAILRAVAAHAPVPLRDLARLVRMPLPVVAAVRRELETAGLLLRGKGVALSESGENFARDEIGVEPKTMEGVGPVPAPTDLDRFAPLLGDMQAHAAAGPPVDVTLDQAPCTPDTALRRAFAMDDAGAIAGRRILIAGDDDSVSIAISLAARAGSIAPRRLTVLEIDQRRIAHLAGTRDRHGFDIELLPHDLRAPLPQSLIGRFDVFQTDPPYTLEGMTLFVSRAIEALEVQPGLPGFLSYADLPPDDMLDLQSRLTELGLAAARVTPSFNVYTGASILGSIGQFLELRTTRRTRSLVGGGEVSGPIYTGEVRPRERRYRCRNCGAVLPVGRGMEFTTIDELKSAGCPRCGHRSFSRLSRRRGS